eukprot:CAMPEP_0170201066 /NCGR_PEP_ID=MMETSP0040_2-20121228/70193_1 /TAXON_ID=641309 /ORGANISM="Lotharella oceanica, Strain CCMP622" /LENGTH=164 /DNA_ID=CAMNT_0010451265 /DNA_START=713 /DNA_END=1207 /DNA_ORIENTATION=-
MEGDLVPRLSLQNAMLLRDFYLNSSVGQDHFEKKPAKNALLVPGKIYWIHSSSSNFVSGVPIPLNQRGRALLRMVTKDEHNKLILGWHIFEQHMLGVYKKNLGILRDDSYKDRYPQRAEKCQPKPKPAPLHVKSVKTKKDKKEARKGKKGMNFVMNILGSEYHV